MAPLGTDATEPLIRMEGVAAGSMHDPLAAVLEDVNWTVAAGDFWVLAGLQGSGKSDFLMMSGGLMPPLRGTYRLFGDPMPMFEDSQLITRLRMGLVFQSGQLFNHLTVWENIALPLRYHRNLSAVEAVVEVKPWLEALGLAPWADSTPGALGRNWQKRVGLARALILKPELLLVDDPLGGLDWRHAQWWLEFLTRLSRGDSLLENRPLTLVVTTADLRPWRARGRQYAIVKSRRLLVLGDWGQMEAGGAEALHELLPLDFSTDRGDR